MKFTRKLKRILAITLALSMIGGCGTRVPSSDEIRTDIEPDESSPEVPAEQNVETSSDMAAYSNSLYSGERPMLINTVAKSDAAGITPNVRPYTIAPDLGNVENLWQFSWFEQNAEMMDQLSENGFVVSGYAGAEFFEVYETNRYDMIPNFITVDSLMHTYHLYFAYLLKNIEKGCLSDKLLTLSRRMLDNSIAQYEQLKGSEWENAAERNVAFFTIGTKLLDDSTAVHDDVAEIVQYELAGINGAEGIGESKIIDKFEDYTQYKPRGYYEGDEQLEKYFKAMMWYGRMHFEQSNEDMDRSALLITKSFEDDEQSYGLWEGIYAVTSFFAGASDDLGVCEYAPVMREAYGENISVRDLAGNTEAFQSFHDMTGKLPLPQINSIPIWDGEDNVIPGFRFMGQRFTIDAAVMQQLIYQRVKQNSAGARRMLPDVFDLPAALGSDMALDILKNEGAADYQGYTQNMEKLRNALAQENPKLWSASLYAGWIHTLRPLLEEKGEGYPVFMQNDEWTKKNLECFAGSFAELKHDTILYAKQVIAEMGGGPEQEPDDRGYVEPQPLVYERFVTLADQTAQGLKKYGMLDAADEENLTLLSQIAIQLQAIAEKELRNELPADEEFEFIKGYGGSIEHFWQEVAKAASGEEYVATLEYPAAIVADIATDPDNGFVLEVGTGNPQNIYVVIEVDGKIKISRGSVYKFYQFPWAMDDRLTDSKWRQMIGVQQDEEGYYNQDVQIKQPEWTESYRYEW